jgi:O-methyltransferase involved in polyketide biosynthesis
VVALAEGLQTSFWRLDHQHAIDESRWYSVDLPPVMALRADVLPADDRIVALGQSALDLSWMDRVDATHGVLITAEGLLMYLPPDDALGLIRDCATRFPGGAMMFDSIPHWFSARTMRGLKLSDRYVAPPMPFALSADEGLGLAGRMPGVTAAQDVHLPPGRGAFKLSAWPPLDRGLMRRTRPSITLVEFAR